MSNRAWVWAVAAGVLVLVLAAVVIGVREWRATEDEDDRLRQEYTCAIQREEGVPLDEDC